MFCFVQWYFVMFDEVCRHLCFVVIIYDFVYVFGVSVVVVDVWQLSLLFVVVLWCCLIYNDLCWFILTSMNLNFSNELYWFVYWLICCSRFFCFYSWGSAIVWGTKAPVQEKKGVKNLNVMKTTIKYTYIYIHIYIYIYIHTIIYNNI